MKTGKNESKGQIRFSLLPTLNQISKEPDNNKAREIKNLFVKSSDIIQVAFFPEPRL